MAETPKTNTWQIETRCLQEGWKPKNGEPRILPIYQSTTFKYDSTEDVAKLFDLSIPGHFYSRLSNPTVECLENKLANLEGGTGALCCASGQAATLITMLNLCQAGDHIIAASAIHAKRRPGFGIWSRRACMAPHRIHEPET